MSEDNWFDWNDPEFIKLILILVVFFMVTLPFLIESCEHEEELKTPLAIISTDSTLSSH